MTMRIGTRASALATTQTSHVADAIEKLTGDAPTIVEVSTTGDASAKPLNSFGGQGVFVSALRDALADGRIDVAVHSLKDVPTTPDPRLVIAAIPVREDVRDVLVARDGLTLGELPSGSVVATGSLRRIAQINALGLGLELVGIRGNVGTRLNKVRDGEVDAVVLAKAGLNRLGLAHEATEVLDPVQVLPAPGQGALAVECRAEDAATIALLQRLDDFATRSAVTAERALLATLEAGCSAPVGALAEIAMGDDGDELWLRAVVAHSSGSPSYRASRTGPVSEAAEIGQLLADDMLAEGVAELMAVSS